MPSTFCGGCKYASLPATPQTCAGACTRLRAWHTHSALFQALPYNTGVDAGTVTDTIARAKQRLAPGDPASAAIAPVATTIITTATPGGKPPEPVEDVEIAEDEDEEAGGGGGAATAAARLASDLAEVEALTALPQAEDELLYAVPMCAPYDSLSRCKFRVKLVPGSQRKGKASKQLLDLLVRSGEATPRCGLLPRGRCDVLWHCVYPVEPHTPRLFVGDVGPSPQHRCAQLRQAVEADMHGGDAWVRGAHSCVCTAMSLSMSRADGQGRVRALLHGSAAPGQVGGVGVLRAALRSVVLL